VQYRHLARQPVEQRRRARIRLDEEYVASALEAEAERLAHAVELARETLEAQRFATATGAAFHREPSVGLEPPQVTGVEIAAIT
jgi:hypothetical protein